ncbi:hypothetical protein J6590_101873 [Homalodisca vitripennis]|nr:hypothetical protein J6590_101873 [Homalodisca vitripennis]
MELYGSSTELFTAAALISKDKEDPETLLISARNNREATRSAVEAEARQSNRDTWWPYRPSKCILTWLSTIGTVEQI